MNGKRAKALRAKARELNGGTCWSSFNRVQHRPKPVLDRRGRLIGQMDNYTDVCEGFRRVYQDLKRAEGLRQTGRRELTQHEIDKLQEVLRLDEERRERAVKRVAVKDRKRLEYLDSLKEASE